LLDKFSSSRESFLALAFILTAMWAVPVTGSEANPQQVREELKAGVEMVYSGDYDRAWEFFTDLSKTSPLHPGPQFYKVSVLFWRTSADAGNPLYDEEITALLNTSIGKAEAWRERDPQSVDALHYLGLGYTYLGRLEAHRGRIYSGGVHGEKGRDYLEQAIAMWESPANSDALTDGYACEDVHFPFGAYSYFAGRLPAFLARFSFLWFIPSGTTEEGLAALERAQDKSDLHALGATNLLINIYSIFEKDQADRALELSREMVARFPYNAGIDVEHSNVLNRAAAHGEASAHARSVLAKVDAEAPYYDRMVEFGARLAIGEAAVYEGRLDDGRSVLEELRSDPSFQNNTLTPRIALLLGMLSDLEGKREQALTYYKEVTGYEGRTWNRQAEKQAEHYMEIPFSVEAAGQN